MPIYADVITRLDERAAQVTHDQIERQFGDTARSASASFTREMSRGISGLKGMASEVGAGLKSGIDSQLGGLGGTFDAISSKMGGIGVAGGVAAGGVAAIGLAALAAGKQLYDLGSQWDGIADGITIRTGKVGAELERLTDLTGDVGRTTAASLESIGNIMGQISQSMPDLAQSNTAVRQMASNLAFLDANGQSVNIRELGKAFNAFGVNASDQVKTLDSLNEASQDTGIPINQLIDTVRSGAPQFKQFGLDIAGATSLIASFEDAGLDSGSAVTGLRTALKNVSDDARGAGPALAEAVTQIKAFHDAGQESSALNLAQDTFGVRNFAPFLDAIENGAVTAETLNKALERNGLSVQDLQDETSDLSEEWQKLKNTVSDVFEPAAAATFQTINVLIEGTIDSMRGWADMWDVITHKAANMPSGPLTRDANGNFVVPTGPVGAGPNPLTAITGASPPGGPASIVPFPMNVPGGPGMPGATALPPPSTGTPTAPGLGPNFYKDWYEQQKGTPKLPGAPVVPFDSTLPPGFENLPQTASLYSAESSFLDARHATAEKQARLTQLEGDNTAKAEDKLNARNDVMQAERAQNEALLRLYDTQNKQMKDQTAQLGDIGAQLDSDFGISKGLAGIAENVTKFVANLAFAPLMGKLEAIKQANPSQGGYGATGIAAAQGAFGPQFTGITPQASALGPAALAPGGGVAGLPGSAVPAAGAPVAGESSRDFAHRVMMPYWQSQGLTVGDHQADKYGEHQNGALDIMVDSIAEGNAVLQKVLQDPNVHGAIFNNQTYGYGHGTTPQDYSAGHTGDPTQDHKDHVHAWYEPGAQGNIVPSGAGAGTGGYSPSTASAPTLSLPGTAVMPGWGSPLPSTAPSGEGTGFGFGAPTSVGAGAVPGGGMGLASPYPGIGAGAIPGGPGANPTQIGGATAGLEGQGGGIGISGGLMDAGMMAAGGLDMLAPGMGQVAQTGMKLANRAIQFGSQAVGIGVQGAIDTFLPMGGSKLASSNWFTKILGGVAGAHPTLPNVAGKGTQQTPQSVLNPQDPNAPQGQGGQGGNTYNANITNNQPRDEGGAGRDALHIWQNQGPGM